MIPKLPKAQSPTIETPDDVFEDPNEAPASAKEDKGMTTGGVVAVSVGGAATAGVGGASVWWFAIKKKKFSDLVRLLKRTPKV